MLLSMKKGVFKYYIRILWGVGGVQVHRENVKTITLNHRNIGPFSVRANQEYVEVLRKPVKAIQISVQLLWKVIRVSVDIGYLLQL